MATLPGAQHSPSDLLRDYRREELERMYGRVRGILGSCSSLSDFWQAEIKINEVFEEALSR
jgi:hypothetical protein